jgi:hypothetical protein
MTLTLKPFALASSAAASKNSVAVLNTPVMSGGVHPMTISCSTRAPSWSPSPRPHAVAMSTSTAIRATNPRMRISTSPSLFRRRCTRRR